MEIKKVSRDNAFYYQVIGSEITGRNEILFEGLTPKEARAYINGFYNQMAAVFFELAVKAKKDAFDKFLDRTVYFTSDRMYTGSMFVSDKGVYFSLTGTRSRFTAFVTYEGAVVRKPKNIVFSREHEIKGIGYELDN